MAQRKYQIRIEAVTTGGPDVNKMADDFETLARRTDQAGDESKNLADELRKLGQERTALDNLLTLDKTAEKLAERQNQLSDTIKQTGPALEKLAAETEKLKTAYDKAQQAADELTAAEKKQREQKRRLIQAEKSAKKSKAELKAEQRSLTAEIKKADEPNEELIEAHKRVGAELEKVIASEKKYRAEIDQLNPRIKKTAEAKEKLAREARQARVEFSKSEVELKKLNKTYSRQASEAKKLGDASERLADDLGEARVEAAKLGVNINNLGQSQAALKIRMQAAGDTVEKFTSQMRSMGREGKRAGRDVQTGMENASRGARDLRGAFVDARHALLGLLAVTGLGRLSGQVIEGADAWKRYETQLKLATDSAEDQARAEEALFQISQDTSTALEGNVKLFSRLAQGSKEFGVTQEELIRITGLLAQTMKLSGATVSETESVMTQFSQAMQKGTLDGDELKSMMENGGRAARALAEGLGVPIGALKDMGAQGELTSKKVIAALLSQQEVIEREFQNMPNTVENALARLSNSFTQYVGESEDVAAVTEKITGVLSYAAENFEQVASLALAAGEAITAAFAIKGLIAIKNYSQEVLLAKDRTGALTIATKAQTKATSLATAATRNLGAALKGIGYTAIALQVADITTNLVKLYEQEQKNAELQKEVAASYATVEEKLAAISEQTGVNVSTMEELEQAVEEQRLVFDASTGTWKGGAEALELVAKQAEKAAEAARKAKEDFKTDVEVQNGFFVLLQQELSKLTKDTMPAFLQKMAEWRRENLIGQQHAEALRVQLVEQAKAFEDQPNLIDGVNRKLEEMGTKSVEAAADLQALKTQTEAAAKAAQDLSNVKISIDVESGGVTEFSDGLQGIHQRAREAGAEVEGLGQSIVAMATSSGDARDAALAWLGAAAELDKAYRDGTISLDTYNESAKELTRQHQEGAEAAGQAAEGAQKVAEGTQEVADAAVAGSTGLDFWKFMNDYIQGARDEMEKLSEGALEMFNRLQDIYVASKGGQIIPETAAGEIKKVAHEIREIQQSLNFATSDISEWFKTVNLNAARTKKAFLEQTQSAEAMIARLEDMDGANQNVVRSAQTMVDSYELLDSQTLSALESEVDRVTAANERLIDSAERALERYQDMVDRQAGDELAIAERERLKAVEDLEEQLRAARKAGNLEAIKDLEQALALAKQYHAEQIRQLKERLAAEQQITDEKERQIGLDRLPASQEPGGGTPPPRYLPGRPGTPAAPGGQSPTAGPPPLRTLPGVIQPSPQFTEEIAAGVGAAIGNILKREDAASVPRLQLQTAAGDVSISGAGTDTLLQQLAKAKLVAL